MWGGGESSVCWGLLPTSVGQHHIEQEQSQLAGVFLRGVILHCSHHGQEGEQAGTAAGADRTRQ